MQGNDRFVGHIGWCVYASNRKYRDLGADNGASMSRLRFAGEEMAKQETNLVAAMGRITDVDIAAESTRMAKYNVLVQASTAMLSQANSSTGVALMLLR